MKSSASLLSPEMPSAIPPFSLMGGLSPIHLMPIAVLILLTLFAPSNVLEHSPIANNYTVWMVKKWPTLGVHAASTKFSQVALLSNCLMVSLIPILTLVWWIQIAHNFPILVARSRKMSMPLGHRIFLILFSAPATALLIWILVGLPGDPSFAKGLTTDRRLGIALLNGFMAWGGSGVFATCPLQVWLLIDVFAGKSLPSEPLR